MSIAAVARSQVDRRLVFARPLPVASSEDLLFAGPPLDIGKRKGVTSAYNPSQKGA